jgi:hypothetical protein
MIMLYSSLGPVFGFAAMLVITCAPTRAMKA